MVLAGGLGEFRSIIVWMEKNDIGGIRGTWCVEIETKSEEYLVKKSLYLMVTYKSVQCSIVRDFFWDNFEFIKE